MFPGFPDPIDDALDDLRVSGAVLLHEAYRSPWAIAVPGEDQLRQVLGVGNDVRLFVFHLVRREGFELQMDGQEAVPIRTAEVVICSGGIAHQMRQGTGAKSVPLEGILRGEDMPVVACGTAGATELVCGVFYMRAAPLNPMLGALPSMLRVATDNAVLSPVLASVATLLAQEVDRGTQHSFTAARLLEVFCAEAIRTYQRTEGAISPGWFKGLADPRISEAIRHIHAAPAQDWSVQSLASTVALSPSRFAARFKETTGQSVMGYVSNWRANAACRLLHDTDLDLTRIAHRVGYECLPAFSRAFKEKLGKAPAIWRIETGKSRKKAS
jgi:AraC-like DNA-binding protein